ncbi:MAG: hypothetical protein Q9163_000313 [Psora crenata]
MGRIRKAAGPKHEATVSPAVSEFVTEASNIPICLLPDHLRKFPRRWPLPRGDLYHWIPLLNRFDLILEQFVKEYGLDIGPQSRPFGIVLLQRAVAEESKTGHVKSCSENDIELRHFDKDGDRQLVEEILQFSRTLLENCGNRSLYASSERLGDLLNTTNLSLLSTTLHLMVRLAQRYHASRHRSNTASSFLTNALLTSHYNIDLEKVQKLAEPFVKSSASPQATAQKLAAKGKGKEKASPAKPTSTNANDMLSLLHKVQPSMNGSSKDVKLHDMEKSRSPDWEDWGGVLITWMSSASKHDQKPATPTPTGRPSSLSRPSRLSSSDDASDAVTSPVADAPDGKKTKVQQIELHSSIIDTISLEDTMRDSMDSWPKDLRYEVLNRVRVARAIIHSPETRQQILGIRLLAITNLAYVYAEDTFKQKILQRDSDEPRNLQLVHQLSELVHPPSTKAPYIPLKLQTLALGTLEALVKHKTKALDVASALSVNVNHGVLFYLLRKAVGDMGEDGAPSTDVGPEEWREALFALLDTLPSSSPRTGDALIGAGVLDLLIEVLNLRTQKAERSYPKTLTFLNNLVGPIRDAFQTLANARGLEAISNLMAYEVNSAMERAQKGEGLLPEYRNRLIDYHIPFFSQQTLRMVFKIISQMMSNNSGNFDRLLRNFIDSPSLLSGLRTVIVNPKLFGSSVWSGAVNIMSSFIHNEPTSYAIISEAGISKGFLETLSTKPLDIPMGEDDAKSSIGGRVNNASSQYTDNRDDLPDSSADTGTLMSYFNSSLDQEAGCDDIELAKGILPATDAIVAIPHAFGAICLNHAGMDMFKKSNALDNFFGIFESPLHIKSMTSERDLAGVLGNSFDELVRHHPALKIWVLSSLLKMINRLKSLCASRGKQYNSGAKLWLNGENGKLEAAGDNLLGEKIPSTEEKAVDDDVLMGDGPTEMPEFGKVSSFDQPSAEKLVNEDPNNRSAATTLTYISVAMKFLSTFLENTQMCSAFVDAGGAERILELATIPTLPYDFNIHEAAQEIMKVMHLLAQLRPHLVLPPLLQRTQAALDTLAPLYNYVGSEGFFKEFTPGQATQPDNAKAPSHAAIGTGIVQSLVHVHTLGNILFEIFTSPYNSSRSTQTPFSQVNLTDVYRNLIKILGLLHRSCVWECLLVQKRLPESWKQDTRVKGFGMGGSEADEILGFVNAEESMSRPESVPVDSNGGASGANSNPSSLPSKKDENTAAFKNVRTLRFLLTQIPSTLVQFLRGLGKLLVVKRRGHHIDSYLRQNASIVADAISDASMAMFQYENPHRSGGKDLYDYWVVVITSIAKVIIEDQPHSQVSTLLLQSFNSDGGLGIILRVLAAFHDEINLASEHGDSERLKTANRGIHVILEFYTQILSHRSIVDANQSQAMHSIEPRPGHAFYFNPHQFLLELRIAVFPVAKMLWQSTFVEKADSSIIRGMIEIMKTLLDASEEHGVPREMAEPSGANHKVYEIAADKARYLMEKGFDEDLAREALYRCTNVQHAALAYCQRLRSVTGASRLPIPDYDKEPPQQRSVPAGSTADGAQADSIELFSEEIATRRPTVNEDIAAAATGLALLSQADRLPPLIDTSTQAAVEGPRGRDQGSSEMPPPPPAPGVPAPVGDTAGDGMAMSLDNLQSMLRMVQDDVEGATDQNRRDPSLPSYLTRSPSWALNIVPQPFRTVEDLKAARDNIRKDLVDRALDILNAHNDVTFELADLISTATSKKSDPKGMRGEIGATLIQSLISFELDDNVSSTGRKVAAYAHLLALVLQDKDFFEANSGELMENFQNLVGFIKFPADHTLGMTTTPWISQTLLVIERVLAEEAQPPSSRWLAPGPDSFPATTDIDQPEPFLVSEEAKSHLFEALLELMPHTKKDEPMVLSIARVLVILTRNRAIASRLAEKKNIQRLLLMIKQLSGVTDDRLTGVIVSIIRHMVEDEEIIRRVMRSEILNNFETRPNRPMDAQTYARAQSHLAIRSPEIFVEVSNEVLEVSGYDYTQRPQALKLKPETPPEPVPVTEESGAAEGISKDHNGDHTMQDKTPSIEGDQTLGSKSKPYEKPPIVERPSGVIHYLLTELLGYKDADDTVSSTPSKPGNGDVNITSTGDGQTSPNSFMDSNAQYSSEDISLRTTAGLNSQLKTSTDAKRTEFKPDENPIHMYRCFILQCLTELLHSYNQAKIEFINFSRKAEAKATTPSKPRSGVLNYLLHEAVPGNPLNADKDTIGYYKRTVVSNWAMSAIVALCLKTNELGYNRKPGTIEEDEQADLVFVRKFVLEHALKAYKDANASEDDLTIKYGRLSDLADLFHRILHGIVIHKSASPPNGVEAGQQKAIAKIMVEKNFIAALTSSIADLNLSLKHVERVIKCILRPLRQLTSAAIELSETSSIAPTPGPADEDEISSASSVSVVDDGREETPDLFRNSTLGMFEPGREEPSSSESSRTEDDEMYDDGYYDGMEEEDQIEQDTDEVISDEDEELGDVGPMEGLHGDPGMDMEVVIDEEDDESSGDDEDADDSVDSDEIEELDDVNGDDENASLADGEDDEEWQDEMDGSQDDQEQHNGHAQDTNEDRDAESAGRDIVGDLGGPVAALQRLEELESAHANLIMDIEEGRYMDEADQHEDDEDADEDEDDEDIDDEELLYEPPDYDESRMPDPPWGWDDPDDDPFPRDRHRHHRHHHHHHHHNHRHQPRHLPDPWTIFTNGPPPHRVSTNAAYRSHRNPISGPRSNDDGINPLLQRSDRPPPPTSPRSGRLTLSDPLALSDYFYHGMDMGDMARDSPVSIFHNLIQAIGQGNNPAITAIPGPGGALHVQLAGENLPRDLQAVLQGGYRHQHIADFTRSEGRPLSPIFLPQPTFQRWTDEAKMLFGASEVQNRAQRVTSALLRVMVPPALEKKKRKDEEENRQREEMEKQRKAREEIEEKERNQREKAEAEAASESAATAQARTETEAETASASHNAGPADAQNEVGHATEEPMEGVESGRGQPGTSAPVDGSEQSQGGEQMGPGSSHPVERQLVAFNGTQLDITDMGIDLTYLDALPEDIRNEVLMSQLAMQRAQTAAAGETPTEIDNDFLEALPADIRAELLQQEAQERRRREREEARRRQAAAGGPGAAEEMDPASFLASLDPQLRQHVLMEQDEEMLAHLPAEIAAEARALGGDRPVPRWTRVARLTRPADIGGDVLVRPQQSSKKPARRQFVQMLDRGGIATLLRLMFIQQLREPRESLNRILHDIVLNRVNRAEVISLLLSILQDGSSDASAVERSFAQLSLRAKQTVASRTPLKRTVTDHSLAPIAINPELRITPLMVIQQCLGSLASLSMRNPHVTYFFLTENDFSFAVKWKSSRKGKGRETKASRYPINALLSLLDRPLITENMACVHQLASLLQDITHPLNMLLRKEKGSIRQEKPEEATAQAQLDPRTNPMDAPTASGEQTSIETVNQITEEGSVSPMADVQRTTTNEEQAPAEVTEGIETHPEQAAEVESKSPRKTRILMPPIIPEENLCPVVNIIIARECPSDTFRATLSTMTNLCAIPGAKRIFGKRLVESALDLGHHILDDLNELIPQIRGAASGTDLQGMALTKFSPQSSDQAKLLRVLKALDYLYDPKREEVKPKSDPQHGASAELSNSSKADLVMSLYEDPTFGLLWDKLGECLSAIRQGSGMLNVATILLPLVEALMVVCTNTTIKEASMNKTVREFAITSPAPESRMESLFFRFTEEHRKILNDLVRHNPKLMSGTFQLLVKNPKVLEFDNKRNYFTRRLHSRGTEARHPQPPLQLAVRRDQVFLDSFKALSFKTGDEIKYGKLSIRFAGEEGVDAGGVTREWFQVLSRQMFNPDYALFIPVASDRTTFHPNKLSSVNEEHLMFFKFIGRIIGKALYEGRALDCHFSRAVYKRILGKTVSIKDMETLDLDYYKSLLWMLENDITEIITETMSVQTDDFGVTDVVDLVPNGRKIPVTEENKQEYVQLVVEYRLTGSVQSQLEKFLEGFHDIVPPELISIFDEQELELLISGLPDIDVDDWKNHTEYHNYQVASPQIQWFWRAVRSFDKEERAKLLQFVTGTSKVPLNGFGQLEGMNGFSRFNIHRDYGNKDRLPSSHTCFNPELDLPEYESYETLRRQLYTAMTAGSEYFGFA